MAQVNTDLSEHDRLRHSKEKAENQYVPSCDSKEYRDAKVYTHLLRGDLYMIAKDTSDAKTKERIEELLNDMNVPKLIQRFTGRVKVDKIEESPLIVEFYTRTGKYIYTHRETLPTRYSIFDLFNSLGIENIRSGVKQITENGREDEMGNEYYHIWATIDGEEHCLGITNFEIPTDLDEGI